MIRFRPVAGHRGGWLSSRVLWLGALVALVLVGAACGSKKTTTSTPQAGGTTAASDPYGVIRIKKGQAIDIGDSAVLSGSNAVLGEEQQNAVKLAVEQKGAIKGFSVNVVPGDDGCGDAAAASAVANRFVSDASMAGVIGTTCSSGMLAALPIYNKVHMVAISPSATSGKLPQQGFDVFFRTAWNDDNQGPAQAKYVKDVLKAAKVAVLHDDSAYGQGLAAAFVKGYQDSSHQVVSNDQITANAPDYSSFIARIKAKNPDFIYYAGFFPDSATLLRQMHQAGLSVPFLSGDGSYDPGLIQKAGKDAEGAYVTRLTGGTGPQTKAFDSAYQSKYGNVNGAFIAFAWDGANILLNSIDKVAQVDSQTGDLLIGRKALRDAVAATSYDGATGKISFLKDGDREPSGLKLEVAKVENGKFVVVTQ